jgi:hypothetical protein
MGGGNIFERHRWKLPQQTHQDKLEFRKWQQIFQTILLANGKGIFQCQITSIQFLR